MPPQQIDPEQAKLRIMAARIVAERRWPYLATLLYSLRIVEVDPERLETMAVDSGWRLYYSPAFVLSESVEALATVLLHESLHCVMSHAERFSVIADGDHTVWNIAGDCSINEVLDESKMPWTKSVTPVRFEQLKSYGVSAGMLTETTYRMLVAYRDEHSGANYAVGDCGSVGGGDPRGYELSPADADSPAVGGDQRATTRDRVASEVLSSARSQGDVPAGLLRWAEDYLDPKVDWRRVLGVRIRRAVASVAGRRDYSYLRPSRRQPAVTAQGSTVLLPAMRQPAPPRIAIVVDTSGSIGERELRQYVGEVAGIVRSVGVSQGVWVIACDAKAYPPQRLRSLGSVESLELNGGGGTDMGVGIRAALAIHPTPQVVVVITDGYTDWPAEKPAKSEHVIVALSDVEKLGEIPTWASVVCIEE